MENTASNRDKESNIRPRMVHNANAREVQRAAGKRISTKVSDVTTDCKETLSKHPIASLAGSVGLGAAIAGVAYARNRTGSSRVDIAKGRLQDMLSSGESMLSDAAGSMREDLEPALERGRRALDDLRKVQPNLMPLVWVGAGAVLAGLLAKRSTASDNSNLPYERRSREELYERARKLKIEGRSTMNKEELIEALRAASH